MEEHQNRSPVPFFIALWGLFTLVVAFLGPHADMGISILVGGTGALLLLVGCVLAAGSAPPETRNLAVPTLALSVGPMVALFASPTAGMFTSSLAILGLAVAAILAHPDAEPTGVAAPTSQEMARKEAETNAQLRSLLSTLDELESAGTELTGTSARLAATAREQEASIAEQAAAATQIMATSREINATSRELAHTMEEVAKTAESSAQLANVGQDWLARMQTTMDQVIAAAGGVSAKLTTLSERANKIGTVVVTIARVADQTNLLSLNAAIEAEKAGEYGRGFGVVATEIRRLADQTAVATLDIEHMIKEVLSAVSSGVMGMEKFTEDVRESADTAHNLVDQLGQIITGVQTMSERFEQVNYGMKSQAQGAEQITESIRQLSEATHHTAGSIKEFNSAIQALQGASQIGRAHV